MKIEKLCDDDANSDRSVLISSNTMPARRSERHSRATATKMSKHMITEAGREGTRSEAQVVSRIAASKGGRSITRM